MHLIVVHRHLAGYTGGDRVTYVLQFVRAAAGRRIETIELPRQELKPIVAAVQEEPGRIDRSAGQSIEDGDTGPADCVIDFG
jgi:hypothetical protein